LISAK